MIGEEEINKIKQETSNIYLSDEDVDIIIKMKLPMNILNLWEVLPKDFHLILKSVCESRM